MAQRKIPEQTLPQENSFYRNHYHHVIFVLMIVIVLLAVAVGVVLYQMIHRPLPVFQAMQPNGQKMQLTPFDEPNLLPDTIIQWGSKAAVLAYTFDFFNYPQQQVAARPYFTDAGWRDYLRSVSGIINDVVANKLIITSVVSGTPVIANEGDLPGTGYTWRIQIPFLVTYQSANIAPKRDFFVILTIVRVPTNQNPQGIGIDQFVMVSRG